MTTNHEMKTRAHRFKNLIGQRFGRLLVVAHVGVSGRHYRVLWRCWCECGKTTIAPTHKLNSGARVSCGCSRTMEKARAASIAARKERAVRKKSLRSRPIDYFLYQYHQPNQGATPWNTAIAQNVQQ